MVGNTVDEMYMPLSELSSQLQAMKDNVFNTFETIIELKGEIYGVKESQKTHSFSNHNNTRRITLGYRVLDRYDDTVNVGIEKIRQYLDSLITDENSKQIINMVNNLLKRDEKGNMKANRVLDLQKMAKDINSRLFDEGVEIILDSYKPERSSTFVTAEYKDKNNKWQTLTLSMTSM